MATNKQYFSGDVLIHGQTSAPTTTATSWAATIASSDGRVVAEERLAVVRSGLGSTTRWETIAGSDTAGYTGTIANLVGVVNGETGQFRPILATQATTPSTVVIRDTTGNINIVNLSLATSLTFNFTNSNGGGGLIACSCSTTATNTDTSSSVTLLDFNLGTRTSSSTLGNLSLAGRGSISVGFYDPTVTHTGWGSFDVEWRAGAQGSGNSTIASTITLAGTYPNQFNRVGKSLDSNITSCDVHLITTTQTDNNSHLQLKVLQGNSQGAYWAGLFSVIELHP